MAKVREFGVGFENLHTREFVAHARRAEELGFGTFWIPEDPFYRGAFTVGICDRVRHVEDQDWSRHRESVFAASRA